MDDAALVAAGWARFEGAGFSAAIGPTWTRGGAGTRVVGLLTGPAIANNHAGTVHGGAMMTFADIALGFAVVDVIGEPRCATMQLQYQFAGAVRVGAFVTCAPEVVRETSQFVFVRGLFRDGERTVGSADGIFKVFAAHRSD